ncbi:MAG: type II toxin-antitoxin system RelE/ParE family toxin [Thermomicrobiales bacterium]
MSSDPWAIVDTPYCQRALKRFLKKHPDLRRTYDDIIHLLAADPHEPSLRLHPLGGTHAGEHAVSVTYSYRMILTIVVIEHHIVLLDIGSHDDVYRQ